MIAKIKWYVLSFFIFIVVMSCKDTSHVEEVVHDLQVSVKELPVLSSGGGTIKFTVTSTMPWSIGNVKDWCTVSPVLGLEGTTEVTVVCSENKEYDERNSSIQITSGMFSENLILVQKQKDALLLSSNKIECNSEGGNIVVDINSNVSFQFDIEDSCSDWIKVNENRALIKSSLNIIIGKNDNMTKREGKITIKGESLDEVISVYQEGFEPTIVLSRNEYKINSGENTIKIELKSNVDYEMVLPENVDWIKQSETRALSSYTHYLSIAENDTYEMRETEICFTNSKYNVEEKVKIIQMQRDAILVAQNEYFISAETSRLEFDVNTNVDFEVETSVSWIKHKGWNSRSLVIVPVRLELDENTSLESREGYVYIRYGDILQTIKIVQQGRVDYSRLIITHDNPQFQIPYLIGNNIIGNINWGDGKTDIYKDKITHSYFDDSMRMVTVECWGAKEVQIFGIKGILEVDLSEF